MSQKNGLTTQGLTPSHILLVLFSIGMVGLGAYLTQHWYELHFSTGLGAEHSSLCNISSFFSCDGTSQSSLGKILGVPTSYYGIFLGIFLLMGSLFSSPAYERTSYFVLLINALACLLLFLYSLIVVGGLCPMCTLYYILSFAALALFWKFSPFKPLAPSPIILGAWTVVALIAGFFIQQNIQKKIDRQIAMDKQLSEQFKKLKIVGDPHWDSEFRLASSSEKFSDAPIRISIFSDFQCPACQWAAHSLDPILKQEEFKGKINVQYYFYPLDMKCNDQMEFELHPYACNAAKIAVCSKEKFKEVHDRFFRDQKSINDDYLKSLVNELGIEECFNSPEAKDIVVKSLKLGNDQYKVTGTPTVIINGAKVKPLTSKQYEVLFRGILNP